MPSDPEHVDVERVLGHSEIAREVFRVDPPAARLWQTVIRVCHPLPGQRQQQKVLSASSKIKNSTTGYGLDAYVFFRSIDGERQRQTFECARRIRRACSRLDRRARSGLAPAERKFVRE
jgi:hypothetical protein